MNKNSVTFICAAFAAALTLTTHAAAPTSATQFTPKLMNYQGYLANPSTGVPYTDGIYQLECRLYRQASGGTAIWGGRYSVYVKDGYFNIMLGDTSATNLGLTYANADLWRALWSDTAVAVASRNDLWLGVTPLQGPTGASISSPTEISPRQQLLAGPYAFRAQAAEYANQSYTDFKVNGKLTVTGGTLAFPNTFSMPWINVTSNSTSKLVRLGGTSYSATTNPTIYLYGNAIGLYSYGNIYLSSYSGDTIVTVPSGKSFRIQNNYFAVTNIATTMKSSSLTSIDGGSSLTLMASYVSLSPSTNMYLYGQGTVSWKAPGLTSTHRPMVIKAYTVRRGATYFAADDGVYRYIVTGYGYNQAGGGSKTVTECYTKLSNKKWYIQLDWTGSGSEEDSWTVYVLGIHKSFVNDNRTW